MSSYLHILLWLTSTLENLMHIDPKQAFETVNNVRQYTIFDMLYYISFVICNCVSSKDNFSVRVSKPLTEDAVKEN